MINYKREFQPMTSQERADYIAALARALSSETQSRWEVGTEATHCEDQINGPGASIFVCPLNGAQRDRMSIAACVDRDLHPFAFGYGTDRPGVTVSRAKPAAQVASELVRRLLPETRAWTLSAIKRRDEEREAIALVDRIVAQLAAVSPRIQGRATHEGGRDLDRAVYLRMEGDSYGDMRVSPYKGGTVQFDLRNIPVEQAVAILKIITAEPEVTP